MIWYGHIDMCMTYYACLCACTYTRATAAHHTSGIIRSRVFRAATNYCLRVSLLGES